MAACTNTCLEDIPILALLFPDAFTWPLSCTEDEKADPTDTRPTQENDNPAPAATTTAESSSEVVIRTNPSATIKPTLSLPAYLDRDNHPTGVPEFVQSQVPQIWKCYDDYGDAWLTIPLKPTVFYTAFKNQSPIGTNLEKIFIGQAAIIAKRIPRHGSEHPSIAFGCRFIRELAFAEFERMKQDRGELIRNVSAFILQSPRFIHLCLLCLSMLIGQRLADRQDYGTLFDVHYDKQIQVVIKRNGSYFKTVFYDCKGYNINESGISFFKSDLTNFHDGYLSLLRLYLCQQPNPDVVQEPHIATFLGPNEDQNPLPEGSDSAYLPGVDRSAAEAFRQKRLKKVALLEYKIKMYDRLLKGIAEGDVTWLDDLDLLAKLTADDSDAE